MTTKRAISLLPALLLTWRLGPAPAAQGGPADPLQPGNFNVLVIVLDDVGTDKLALFDELDAPPYARTPRLDELARGGIRFRNFYVNPVCSSTRALLQTGRYAFRTGMGANTETYRLPDSELLLAELLSLGFPPARPYRCGAFGKWHLGAADPRHAVRNGYDHFSGSLDNVDDHFYWHKIEHDAGSPPRAVRMTDWDASVTRADAVRWINAQERPFFAWVAFQPPHGPWQVPPLALLSNRTRRELAGYAEGQPAVHGPERKLFYRAMLEAVDAEIGRLIDGIDPWKREHTMIFVVSDNGAPARLIEPPHDPSHGKTSVYQLGIRVPMIVAGPLVPPVPPGGHVCDELVQAVDLWRTLAELSGADENLAFRRSGEVRDHSAIDGKSFLPLILAPRSRGPSPWVYSELFGPSGPYEDAACLRVQLRAITDGEYKYLRSAVRSPGALPCEPPHYIQEFYRVSVDPGEKTNLLGRPLTPQQRAVLEHMRAEMDAVSAPTAPERVRSAPRQQASSPGVQRRASSSIKRRKRRANVSLRKGSKRGDSR